CVERPHRGQQQGHHASREGKALRARNAATDVPAAPQPPQPGQVQRDEQRQRNQQQRRERPRVGKRGHAVAAVVGQGRRCRRDTRQQQDCGSSRPREPRRRDRGGDARGAFHAASALPRPVSGPRRSRSMLFSLKVAHIASVAVGFTGLFLLLRLFAARRRGERDARADFFNPAANRLFFRIATPAGVLAIAITMLIVGSLFASLVFAYFYLWLGSDAWPPEGM